METSSGASRALTLTLQRSGSGSHLDSVPNGGRFDGVLGVLAGLEAVERVGRRRRTLAVVAFRDEERGFGGSRARVQHGPLPEALRRGAHRAGPRPRSARAAPLGVVTGIAGVARGEVVAAGRGRTRGDDADGRPARRAVRSGRARPPGARRREPRFRGAVATVGRLEVEPGAANVIPERVTVSVDARAPDRERLDCARRGDRLRAVAARRAGAMDAAVQAVLREELERAACPRRSSSPAPATTRACLPPRASAAGCSSSAAARAAISHSPEEWSDPEDVALCVDVLAATLERLASAP